jgi:hypothetical protein
MKTSTIIVVTLLFLVAAAAPLDLWAAEKPVTEREKIEALIKNLENLKDATFIRNNSEYGSKTAGRFLRGKWQKQEKEIKTAMDFIDKVASVSSTSGKPYVIRFKDSHEVKCGEYLKEELKKLENDKQKSNDATNQWLEPTRVGAGSLAARHVS